MVVQDAIDRLMQSRSFLLGSGNGAADGDDPEGRDPGGHNDGAHGGPRDERGQDGGDQGRGGESRDRNTGGSQSNAGNKFADVHESVAFKVYLFIMYEHPS